MTRRGRIIGCIVVLLLASTALTFLILEKEFSITGKIVSNEQISNILMTSLDFFKTNALLAYVIIGSILVALLLTYFIHKKFPAPVADSKEIKTEKFKLNKELELRDKQLEEAMKALETEESVVKPKSDRKKIREEKHKAKKLAREKKLQEKEAKRLKKIEDKKERIRLKALEKARKARQKKLEQKRLETLKQEQKKKQLEEVRLANLEKARKLRAKNLAKHKKINEKKERLRLKALEKEKRAEQKRFAKEKLEKQKAEKAKESLAKQKNIQKEIERIEKEKEFKAEQEAKKHEENKLKNQMLLNNYLETAVNKGETKEQIIGSLVKTGWPKKFVEKYCNAYFEANEEKVEKGAEEKRYSNFEDEIEKISQELENL